MSSFFLGGGRLLEFFEFFCFFRGEASWSFLSFVFFLGGGRLLEFFEFFFFLGGGAPGVF